MIADQLFFAGINVLLAWSVYLVLMTGSLSFAQGTFMAIGCYGAGVLTVKFGWPLVPATLVGAVLASVVAAVIGWPALRLRGVYLILVTIGITFCGRVLLENIEYVGGVAGFGGMGGTSHVGVAVTVVAVGAALFWLSRSPLQRTFDAVREDDRVAASLGINVPVVRLIGFAGGAFIAALAGSLYGHYMSFVRPENFDILLSVYVVLYVVLGGVNNLWGGTARRHRDDLAARVLPRARRMAADRLRPGDPADAALQAAGPALLPHAQRPLEEDRPGDRHSPGRDMHDSHVLSVSALCKHFGGVRALDGLDLQVRPGEILGIVGPNGAGKTALINTVTGFYRATSGRIVLGGTDITALPLHAIGRLGVGRTFQNIRLFKRMSVLENVLVAHKAHATHLFRSIFRSGSHRAEQAEAMQWLEMLQLADKANRSAASLSYGDARRLEIARALAGHPQLLLLDEPAAGMNESETRRLIDDIQALKHKVGAILLIEHDMDLIRKLSDRLVAMDYGKKIAEGLPADVLRHPDVLKAYLGTED